MGALTLGDYLAQVQSLVHDFTESAWTRREVIRRINDARKDVSLDMQCVRSLVTGVQLIDGVETYSFDGAVAGATIVDPGSGFGGTDATVTFGPPPPGGTQAQATATVVDGQISTIAMVQWGTRYTDPPTLTITDPAGTGSGAIATPVMLGNVINVMSLSPLWNTMRYSLSYKPFGIFQAWARALQAQGYKMIPSMFTIHPGDDLVYTAPVPNQLLMSEWDVVKLATPLVAVNELDWEVRDPWAQAVQYKAAAYLLFKHQNFQQAEYYEHKYDLRVPRIVAGAGGVRIANPYSRNFFEKMRRA